MNPFKKARKFHASARDAAGAFEPIEKAAREVSALIQEISALDLPQAERDMLTREFTNVAVEMRKSGFAATLAETVAAFRTLRDSMRDAAPKPWVN